MELLAFWLTKYTYSRKKIVINEKNFHHNVILAAIGISYKVILRSDEIKQTIDYNKWTILVVECIEIEIVIIERIIVLIGIIRNGFYLIYYNVGVERTTFR